MELWDLYDEHRKPLGRVHQRGMVIEVGAFHLVVETYIVNSHKEFLLTLRAPEKEVFPNYWESCGGSVLAGETSRQAMIRELAEETGIHVVADELMLLMEQTYTYRSTLFDTYLVQKDVPKTDIVLQDGETVDAKWVSYDELLDMMEQGLLPDTNVERFKRVQDLIVAFLSSN